MYEYKVKITKIIDGDTVDADVDLGFNHYKKDRIRLMGLDTPESRTSNKQEKVLGLASKARLKQVIGDNKGDIVLRTSKEGKGKFGRILGTLIVGSAGVDINALMVNEGHARAYYGGSKDELGPWAKEEGDCNCGAKWKNKSQQDKCKAVWYRWTPGGYKEMNEWHYQ